MEWRTRKSRRSKHPEKAALTPFGSDISYAESTTADLPQIDAASPAFAALYPRRSGNAAFPLIWSNLNSSAIYSARDHLP